MEIGEEELVEAIEEGRIVKVPRRYALEEGLLILRKPGPSHTRYEEALRKVPAENPVKPSEPKRIQNRLLFDDFRKPLKKKKSQVETELVEHFNWAILKKRRDLNISRRQLAKEIGVSEKDLVLLENGIIPRDDFVLINKVQNYFGINLRKDRKEFGGDLQMRKIVDDMQVEKLKLRDEELKRKESKIDQVLGEDIEIIEE